MTKPAFLVFSANQCRPHKTCDGRIRFRVSELVCQALMDNPGTRVFHFKLPNDFDFIGQLRCSVPSLELETLNPVVENFTDGKNTTWTIERKSTAGDPTAGDPTAGEHRFPF